VYHRRLSPGNWCIFYGRGDEAGRQRRAQLQGSQGVPREHRQDQQL